MAEENKKSAPKFVYNCVRCGQYCSKVEGVPIYFDRICQSVSRLVGPAVDAKKEAETKRQAYLQRLEQEQREIAQKNEEVALSILLMIASGGLIVSMILFV